MTSNHSATTIPVLPCISLDETLAFYRLLGFEVTHQQSRPYVYAALVREGVHLHFAGVKGLDPKKAFSTCLVIVAELTELYRTFADALRAAYGKLPVAGFPNISRLRKGQSRFRIVDPAGNSIIVIRRTSVPEEMPSTRPLSRLGRALEQAIRFRDFKNDDVAAAKVLDVALRSDEPCLPIERARALAARAELAIVLGDRKLAETLRRELATIELSPADRRRFADELHAATQLERSLDE